MAQFQTRPEEPEEWGGLPSEPAEAGSSADRLADAPSSAFDALGLICGASLGSVLIPVAPQIEITVEQASGDGETPEDDERPTDVATHGSSPLDTAQGSTRNGEP